MATWQVKVRSEVAGAADKLESKVAAPPHHPNVSWALDSCPGFGAFGPIEYSHRLSLWQPTGSEFYTACSGSEWRAQVAGLNLEALVRPNAKYHIEPCFSNVFELFRLFFERFCVQSWLVSRRPCAFSQRFFVPSWFFFDMSL